MKMATVDPDRILIGMVVFPGWELLDSQGPYALLLKMASASPDPNRYHFITIADSLSVSQETTSHQPLVVHHTFATCPPLSVLILPGGVGVFTAERNSALLSFLRKQHANSRMQWFCSVCTGSAVFAQAGILDDRRATSNKALFDVMARYGSGKVHWEREARFIVDGNVITASGVSAGVDMAFEVGRDVFGVEVVERVKREIKYRPLSQGEDPFAWIHARGSEWTSFWSSLFFHALAPLLIPFESNQAASHGLPLFRKHPRNIISVLLFPQFDALDVACVLESLQTAARVYRVELIAVLPSESEKAVQVGGDSSATAKAEQFKKALRVVCDRVVDVGTALEDVFPWMKIKGAGRPIVFVPGVNPDLRDILNEQVGQMVWKAVRQGAGDDACVLGCGDVVCDALEQAVGVKRSIVGEVGWERVGNTWFAETGMKGVTAALDILRQVAGPETVVRAVKMMEIAPHLMPEGVSL